MMADPQRVVIHAPVGRDGPLLSQVLSDAGFETRECGRPGDLATCLQDDQMGVVLLTEEALVEGVPALLDVLRAQPEWSDLPLVLLADGDLQNPDAVDALRTVGNLTILERPLRVLTLVTALHAALRARARQLLVRELVEQEGTARREAEAASRVKDNFLATVSHELRTPLGGILLWTRLLLEGGLDPQRLHEGLEAIERSAHALSKLIEDLLDMSRMMSGKLRLSMEPIDLQPVVGAAVAIVRPAADARGVHLTADIAPVPIVRADPDRIQQVVWNLLSNAVKFTPSGGRVDIGLGCDARQVWIRVADTGAGIDPAFLPFVFDRFRQADTSPRAGLGLGLAISRQLAELHGGTIRAASPGVGQGAVFTVELPIRHSPR